MKIPTPQRLLFALVLSGMGFAAVGLNSCASLAQGETQAKRSAQQGHGHAPHQPLAETQAKRSAQQGHGHAPHQPLAETQARVQIQQGHGHAPYPPVAVVLQKQRQVVR